MTAISCSRWHFRYLAQELHLRCPQGMGLGGEHPRRGDEEWRALETGGKREPCANAAATSPTGGGHSVNRPAARTPMQERPSQVFLPTRWSWCFLGHDAPSALQSRRRFRFSSRKTFALPRSSDCPRWKTMTISGWGWMAQARRGCGRRRRPPASLDISFVGCGGQLPRRSRRTMPCAVPASPCAEVGPLMACGGKLLQGPRRMTSGAVLASP